VLAFPHHVAVHVPDAVEVADCVLSALIGPTTPAAADALVRLFVPTAYALCDAGVLPGDDPVADIETPHQPYHKFTWA